MALLTDNPYGKLNVYYGDLHNHCDLSYGHGPLESALRNARLQLDFASVTVHAVWPDIPTDDPDLSYLIDYHEQGFTRAKANWADYLKTMEAQNRDGEFVTFPSFEWHSIGYGDHCVYYNQTDGVPILDAPDLPTLRKMMRELNKPSFLIPHHIGYKQGSRGINWGAFSDEISPVVEIFSFHGLSESSEGPYPYLHSMGPRHEHSTAQYGWSQGHIFGVVGSTDHHNAFPGSYGYGRLGVWAESLSREAIWEAIQQRRTYALTGDRIDLAFSLNGASMGSVIPANDERWLEVDVCAGSAIDYIDVLYNNRIIHRESVFSQPQSQTDYKVYVEMGWAEQDKPFAWDVDIQIENGRLKEVEPRFRGYGPTDNPAEGAEYAYSSLEQSGENHIHIKTLTRQNKSLHTASTEGVSLQIEGSAHTRLSAYINGQRYEVTLGELSTGSRTFYTGGFVTPALCFHRAVPSTEYQHRFALLHRNLPEMRDWYYVRVRQKNDQWAWSSPIWVEAKNP